MLSQGQVNSTNAVPPSNQLGTGAAIVLTTVPSGPCTVLISNTCGGAVYIGTTSSTSSATGFAIPNNATVEFPGYPGSKGSQLYVIVATGTTITGPVSWIISTAG